MKRTKKHEALDARLTLRLPSTLLKALKHAAIEADHSLQGFVLEALMRLVGKRKKEVRRR